jgi:hypothetical protein
LVSDIGDHGISFIVRQASDQGIYAFFIYISLEKIEFLYQQEDGRYAQEHQDDLQVFYVSQKSMLQQKNVASDGNKGNDVDDVDPSEAVRGEAGIDRKQNGYGD